MYTAYVYNEYMYIITGIAQLNAFSCGNNVRPIIITRLQTRNVYKRCKIVYKTDTGSKQ